MILTSRNSEIKPSTRFAYTLRALVDLALRQGTGPVTVAAIAKRQGIPVRSLEQLFNRLRHKGIVEAERGPRGGYRLKLPAQKIRVRTLFEMFEPSGKGRSASAILAGPNGDNDPAKLIWQQIQKAVETSLEAVTLAQLVDRFRDRLEEPIRHRYTFHI